MPAHLHVKFQTLWAQSCDLFHPKNHNNANSEVKEMSNRFCIHLHSNLKKPDYPK